MSQTMLDVFRWIALAVVICAVVVLVISHRRMTAIWKAVHEPPFFQRRIARKIESDDGSQLLVLDCSHEVVMIVPTPARQQIAWCAECVNAFIEREDEAKRLRR